MFNKYEIVYNKKRFQPEDSQVPGNIADTGSNFELTDEGKVLFAKAIAAAINSSIEHESRVSKVLPLQGVVNLATGEIHIGALTPRDAQSFFFNQHPLFEHKKAGLFETGQYSPRMASYQLRYSAGPSAHQQLLLHAVKKQQVSADDAMNMRGFAINIQVNGTKVTVTIDGNSLSINETAQYLRTVHKPGYELTEAEAKNEVLKAGKVYSPLCEDWIFDHLAQASKNAISQADMDLQLDDMSTKSESSDSHKKT